MSSIENEGVLKYIAAVGANTAGGGAGASRGGGSSGGGNRSWLEALAQAWGQRLDEQAGKITDLSNQIGSAGDDRPSQIVQLTASAQRFMYTSQNAATSQNSVADGLSSLARKQ